MSQIHWINAVSASFADASDWSGGVVPGAGDAAILDAPGSTAYTVTSSANETVNVIKTAANATLSITGGMFTATSGTGAGVNAGHILVADGATLALGGSVDNTGTIATSGDSGGFGIISIAAGGATLSGGGTFGLGSTGSPFNFNIVGGPLTNIDDTISGAVAFSGTAFVNQAAGIVDVTDPGENRFLANIANAGLIESTAGGRLVMTAVFDTLDNSAGGVVFAGDASYIELGMTVVGGTLQTAGTGIIDITDSTLDGRNATVHNQGAAVDAGVVTLEGTIDNSGTITQVVNLVKGAEIAIGAPGRAVTVTLTGGGVVDLGIYGYLAHDGSGAATLINVDNTILGAGDLGAGVAAITNRAGGVIDGNGAARRLFLEAGTVNNAGLLEGTTKAGLVILSAVNNSGVLEANGGNLTINGAVTGTGHASLRGGTLDLASAFTQNVTFSGTRGVLELGQSEGYTGAVSGFSKTGGTSLDLGDVGFVSAGEATFSGTTTSGVLTVTDGTHTAHITLIGNYTASTFIASSDGKGGTIVVDPTSVAAVDRFIAASAGLGGLAGEAIHSGAPRVDHAPMLARPHAMVA